MVSDISGTEALRVVIAGGGIAALETLLGLRSCGEARVELTLVAPDDHFVHRALEVGEPFGLGHPRRYPLAEIARDAGATFRRDALTRVRAGDRAAELASGAQLPYDALVVAVGACTAASFTHGVTFDRWLEAASLDQALADVGAGLVPRVAIVVPPAVSWPLPAYELALMTAAWGGAARPDGVRVTLVSAEGAPLEAFGTPVSTAVSAIVRSAGVTLLTGVDADVTSDTRVRAGRGLAADRIVALPACTGPNVRGLPRDGAGFIPVDHHGRVLGLERVYAAGDGTSAALKHGGLAAQQADAVAEHIAAAAGAEIAPAPYRPVLRGLLRTQDGPRYLRAEPDDLERTSAISARPLWWPPSKIASNWLSPYLARREAARAPPARSLSTGGVGRGAW